MGSSTGLEKSESQAGPRGPQEASSPTDNRDEALDQAMLSLEAMTAAHSLEHGSGWSALPCPALVSLAPFKRNTESLAREGGIGMKWACRPRTFSWVSSSASRGPASQVPVLSSPGLRITCLQTSPLEWFLEPNMALSEVLIFSSNLVLLQASPSWEQPPIHPTILHPEI